MYWSNFLHFYQPHGQHKDIVDMVTAQSYRPLLEGLMSRPHVRITLNINSVLLELFDAYGHSDLITMLRELGGRGQIEFTGSAKYHTILPFLDESEIERQIKINDETARKYLGDAWKPRGFFPPEMAFDKKLIPILERLGYEWVILDEIACGGKPEQVDYTKLYEIEGSSLKAFFRERRTSNMIMGAVIRSAASLKEALKNDLASERYLITAMDGETFGHHRPGLEKFLFEIFDDTEFKLIQISEISSHVSGSAGQPDQFIHMMPVSCTWASSAADIEQGIQFISWADPASPFHARQREFADLALSEVRKLPQNDPTYAALRHDMDIALASDQYFWASAKPWWSVEMIEGTAFQLLEIVRRIPNVELQTLERARSFYEFLVSQAFHWQRSGKIREMMREQGSINRIPFKDRTVGRGGAEEGVYHAFMDMLKDLEKKAVEKGEYEKAILWRDAAYKFEQKHDIYDAVSAIDLLRIEIPNEEVEKTIEQYKDKYRAIRGGQPEQRGS